jgi:hypothetical protein
MAIQPGAFDETVPFWNHHPDSQAEFFHWDHMICIEPASNGAHPLSAFQPDASTHRARLSLRSDYLNNEVGFAPHA